MSDMRRALEALADKMGERCGDHCPNNCTMCEARNDLRLILIRSTVASKSAVRLEYVVVVPDELAAGIRGFTDEITVEIANGSPDWETIQAARAHFQTAISEWYDMGRVWTKEEYETQRPDEGDLLSSDEWEKQS